MLFDFNTPPKLYSLNLLLVPKVPKVPEVVSCEF